MTQCSLIMSGRNNQLIIEQGVRLNKCRIVIGGDNNKVIMHRNVKFYEGGRIKLEDENNVIELGENSDFVNCFFAVSDYNSKVIVGKDCMFSAKIVVRNSDVHSILNDKGERINHAKDTLFGDRVWVGYGAHILKGSRIGDDSIIGTRSVVSGLHIPQGCVAVGTPARIVKQNIHWCRERLKSEKA